MGKQNKKEKTVYVDDGRTLADMSGVQGGFRLGSRDLTHRVKAKDAWHTYWNAVRMMFLPMLAVIGALVVIYIILYVVFMLAA